MIKNKQWFFICKLRNKINSNHLFIPPKGVDFADPFIFKQGTNFYIFFEKKSNFGKGEIMVAKCDKNGEIIESKVALSENFHLSYPFIFSYKNEIYMLPETSEKGDIRLYKSTNFPHEWEIHNVLLSNINAVDSTIFNHNNLWWLLTYVREDNKKELRFYKSLNPLNGFSEEPTSIIEDNNDSLRPAGTIYKFNNNLYFFSQNGAKHYGHSIIVNRIRELNENILLDQRIHELFPDASKKIISTHTINIGFDSIVKDYQVHRKSWHYLGYKLELAFKKLKWLLS